MTSIFKSPTQITQKANGINVPQSLYGQTIPYIFGNTKCTYKLIYANNFVGTPAQEGGGGVQGKKGGKAGGATQYNYSVNADLLVSYGPIESVGTVWQNQIILVCWYTQEILTMLGTGTVFSTNISAGSGNTLVMINGVSYQQSFSESYTDYVYPGETRSFSQSGTTFVPLYNNHYPAPNSGTWQYSGLPYATYNTSPGDDTVTITFPSPVTNPIFTVYFSYYNNYFRQIQKLQSQGINDKKGGKKSGGAPPLVGVGLAFEQILGSGNSGALQNIDFSGAGGANIALGPTPEFPHLVFEVKGLFGLGNQSPAANFDPITEKYTSANTSGDCNPADIMADMICSGNRSPTHTGVWHHGLGFSSLIVTVPAKGNYPNPLHYSRYGGILKDEPNIWGPSYSGGTNLGINQVRNYCGSYGIFISGVVDAQQSASQFLGDLCKISNCAPCYDGVGLDFIPYSEVSNYGNGYSYVPVTSSGPSFDLDAQLDIQLETNTGPITSTFQKSTQNNMNSALINFKDKSLQFNDNTVFISDSLDVTTSGSMPGPISIPAYITNSGVAQTVGWSAMRRSLINERFKYKFSVLRYWESILTLMDFVTISDPSISDNVIPVRIISITIDKDKIQCEAELYSYGSCSPSASFSAKGTGGSGGGAGITFSITNVRPKFIKPGSGIVLYTDYDGTITGGDSNAYAGASVTCSGFFHSVNNGVFDCIGSTATSLSLDNDGGVVDGGGTAVVFLPTNQPNGNAQLPTGSGNSGGGDPGDVN